MGEFEQSVDIGSDLLPGSATFESDSGKYVVTGSGSNIWGNRDEFRFLYKKINGDLTLTTDIEFLTEGGNPHKKAGWMIRESVDPDSAYVDAVVHGDGLISLQYRRNKGGGTEELQSPISGPATIRLLRDGDLVSLSLARPGGEFQPVGAILMELPEEPLVGLLLCSHDSSRIDKVEFINTEIEVRPSVEEADRQLESTLETIDVETGEREVVYSARKHFEAPNWAVDGSYFLFNMEGSIYRLPVEGGEPVKLDTGDADQCNNDHGLSPDGKWLAISHSPEGSSLIYVVPSEGGVPRLVTRKGPSYWHGWSPDGKTLAY